LPSIQQLLAAARDVEIPVIHITMLDADGLPGWSEATRRDTITPVTDPAMLERWRRRTEIVPEVAPWPGELVLRKSAPSAFWGTPLIGQLNYLDVDTLLVAGESTSGCVRATVVDAAAHRFRTIVVEECVFDRHEASHAINLFDMHQKYADVVSLTDALDYLRRWQSEQRSSNGERAGQPVAAR
jgi:nicotinamidase-related amidase